MEVAHSGQYLLNLPIKVDESKVCLNKLSLMLVCCRDSYKIVFLLLVDEAWQEAAQEVFWGASTWKYSRFFW